MLPDNFRITTENQIGGTIDASSITIKYRGKYFSSSGVITFESESADIANQGSLITDTSYNTGTTVDNGVKATRSSRLIFTSIVTSVAIRPPPPAMSSFTCNEPPQTHPRSRPTVSFGSAM